MEGIVFCTGGIGIVPNTVEIAPDAFSRFVADDGAFNRWFLAVEFLTDEVFASLVPAYLCVVWT